jgi:hypothetical protein
MNLSPQTKLLIGRITGYAKGTHREKHQNTPFNSHGALTALAENIIFAFIHHQYLEHAPYDFILLKLNVKCKGMRLMMV